MLWNIVTLKKLGRLIYFFVLEDKVITPPRLSGSILPGITRDSCIQIMKKWGGLKVEEEDILIEDILNYAKTGQLKEVFGTGTAAVISPVGSLFYKGNDYEVNQSQIGEITNKLYETITGIQKGTVTDAFDWITTF